jgi:hypothetical protein
MQAVSPFRRWSPLILLLFLTLVGLALAPAEGFLAGLALVAFLALAAASPTAGFVYLLLAAAAFLGAPARPWFWLLPAQAWLWIAVASARLLGREGPGGGRLWLVILVSLAAVPLGLQTLLARVWATPGDTLIQQMLAPSVSYPVYPASELLNRLLGVLLAATAWRWFSAGAAREALRRLAPMVGVVALMLAGAAVLLDAFPSLAGGSYLSLSLVARDPGDAVTATAYNRQYLLIYLAAALPLMALPWLERGRGRGARLLAAACILAAAAGAAATGQRSLALAVGGALAAVAVILKGRALRRGLLVAGGAAAALAALDAATGATVLGRLWATGAGDYYPPIWQVGLWQLGTHPVLGVGTGQYAAWADAAARALDTTNLVKPEIYSTPHNQLILYGAEGGLLLWAALAASAGVVLARGTAACRRAYDPALAAALISLAVILAFSLTQPVLYFRAFGVWFWGLLGLVGALTPRPRPADSPAGELARPAWAGVVLLLVFLGGAQLAQGLAAPPQPVRAGFHHQESFDGRPGRWMGRRAALTPEGGGRGGAWEACLRTHVPGVKKDPLRLTVWAGDRRAEAVVLDDHRWRRLSVALPPGEAPIIWLEASRVWVPAETGHGSDRRRLSVVVAPGPEPCPGRAGTP